MGRKLAFLFFGALFGFALSRVGASDYNLIYHMFTGEDLTLAFVMGSAIVIGFIGMRVLALFHNKTYKGDPIRVKRKPLSANNVWGGMLFGIGWGVAGACPGTVLAQVGEGQILGLFTLIGLIAGTYLYALIVQRKADT